jgi:hypothetical protein
VSVAEDVDGRKKIHFRGKDYEKINSNDRRFYMEENIIFFHSFDFGKFISTTL